MPPIDPDLPPQQLLSQGIPGAEGINASGLRQLLAAAQILFDGSLADLADDIRRRHDGQPYLFQFTAELGDCSSLLQILKDLSAYEQAQGLTLASVLQEDLL